MKIQAINSLGELLTHQTPGTASDIYTALGNQTANTVLAGPTSGGAALPAFRGIVSADLTTALTTPPAIGGVTPAAGTFTALAGTTGTFTDLVTITKTTEQLRLRYDASNYASFTVDSAGNITLATTGTAAVKTTSPVSIITNNHVTGGALSAFETALSIEFNPGVSASGLNLTMNPPAGLGTGQFRGLNFVLAISGSDGASSALGLVADARNSQSAGSMQLTGASFVVRNTGAGLTTIGTGIASTAIVSSTGNITTANAYKATAPTYSSTGASTTYRGFYAENQGNAKITTSVAVAVDNQSGSSNNLYLLLGTTAPTGNWAIHATTTSDSALAGKLRIGGTAAPSTTLHALTSDSGTNAVVNIETITHNSSGSIAANFGVGSLWAGQDTTTADVSFGRLRYYWAVATHASRQAYGVLSAYDTAERDCIFWGASGSAPMISFLSVTTPIVQTAAWTQTYSTSSHTTANPTATSVSTTASTQTTPWGYGSQAQADDIITELNRLITDVANVKNNVNGIIDDLQAYGLFG